MIFFKEFIIFEGNSTNTILNILKSMTHQWNSLTLNHRIVVLLRTFKGWTSFSIPQAPNLATKSQVAHALETQSPTQIWQLSFPYFLKDLGTADMELHIKR